jgi:hypothetical protein
MGLIQSQSLIRSNIESIPKFPISGRFLRHEQDSTNEDFKKEKHWECQQRALSHSRSNKKTSKEWHLETYHLKGITTKMILFG